MEKEIMWAIHNERFGFYVGTALTRADAVRKHCTAYYDGPYTPSDAWIKNEWKRLKKQGDRAVKVEIVPVT